MLAAARSKLCSSVSAWSGVFASIANRNIYIYIYIYICSREKNEQNNVGIQSEQNIPVPK